MHNGTAQVCAILLALTLLVLLFVVIAALTLHILANLGALDDVVQDPVQQATFAKA